MLSRMAVPKTIKNFNFNKDLKQAISGSHAQDQLYLCLPQQKCTAEVVG